MQKKINKEITTEKLSGLSRIWKEAYSEKKNMQQIETLFENKAREEGFSSKEIDWFLGL